MTKEEEAMLIVHKTFAALSNFDFVRKRALEEYLKLRSKTTKS